MKKIILVFLSILFFLSMVKTSFASEIPVFNQDGFSYNGTTLTISNGTATKNFIVDIVSGNCFDFGSSKKCHLLVNGTYSKTVYTAFVDYNGSSWGNSYWNTSPYQFKSGYYYDVTRSVGYRGCVDFLNSSYNLSPGLPYTGSCVGAGFSGDSIVTDGTMVVNSTTYMTVTTPELLDNASLVYEGVGEFEHYYQKTLDDGRFFDWGDGYINKYNINLEVQEQDSIEYSGNIEVFMDDWENNFLLLKGSTTTGLSYAIYNREKDRTITGNIANGSFTWGGVSVKEYQILINTSQGSYSVDLRKQTITSTTLGDSWYIPEYKEHMVAIGRKSAYHVVDTKGEWVEFYDGYEPVIVDYTTISPQPLYYNFVYTKSGEYTSALVSDDTMGVLQYLSSGTGATIVEGEYWHSYIANGDIWKLYTPDIQGFYWDGIYSPLVGFVHVSDTEFYYNFIYNGNFYTTSGQENSPGVNPIGGVDVIGGGGGSGGSAYPVIEDNIFDWDTNEDGEVSIGEFFSGISKSIKGIFAGLNNMFNSIIDFFRVLMELGNTQEQKTFTFFSQANAGLVEDFTGMGEQENFLMGILKYVQYGLLFLVFTGITGTLIFLRKK